MSQKRAGKILPQALRSLFQKPATVAYPAESEDRIPETRGKLIFDASKCIGCKMCVRDCPTGAIDIQKVGDKQFKAILQMDHCVFCSQCVDTCPKFALTAGPEFELAGLSRGGMKADIGQLTVNNEQLTGKNEE